MRVFDMIKLLVPDLQPCETKIHLATSNGYDDPLDVFLAGKFPEWQSYQNQKNFERRHILALIKLKQRDCWLFAGLHRVNGPCALTPDPIEPAKDCYRYPLLDEPAGAQLTGRLVARFARPGRQSYLNGENWTDQILLAEVYPTRLTIGEFPGFRSVDLSFDKLRLVASHEIASWRSALSNVAGVYLISDTATGQLYVGSASGAGGSGSGGSTTRRPATAATSSSSR